MGETRTYRVIRRSPGPWEDNHHASPYDVAPRRPPPSPVPPRSDQPALAIHLFRTWRGSLEIGAHDKATFALERLMVLSARPEPGNRWDWHARERIR
jgi:hypothetical protein